MPEHKERESSLASSSGHKRLGLCGCMCSFHLGFMTIAVFLLCSCASIWELSGQGMRKELDNAKELEAFAMQKVSGLDRYDETLEK